MVGLKSTASVTDASAVMTVTELDTLSLVPPARFGRLLMEHRWSRSIGLGTLAALTLGRFDSAELAAVEAGRRTLTDDDLVLLSGLYGIHTEPAVHPRRTRLSVDVDTGVMGIGPHRRLLEPGTLADDVLVRYLGLVIALRGAVVGTPIPLRHDDIGVLADALWTEPEQIEDRLALLMTNPRDRVGRRVRRLCRRTVVPEAGILVAATGEGLLVLDNSGERPDPGVAVFPEPVGATVIALARADAPIADGFAARSA